MQIPTLTIMNRHDLCACQQDINHDNRESAAISTTVAGVGGQSQDGMVLPSHPEGKRKMDEVVEIPTRCLLGKRMLNFKTSLESS